MEAPWKRGGIACADRTGRCCCLFHVTTKWMSWKRNRGAEIHHTTINCEASRLERQRVSDRAELEGDPLRRQGRFAASAVLAQVRVMRKCERHSPRCAVGVQPGHRHAGFESGETQHG